MFRQMMVSFFPMNERKNRKRNGDDLHKKGIRINSQNRFFPDFCFFTEYPKKPLKLKRRKKEKQNSSFRLKKKSK